MHFKKKKRSHLTRSKSVSAVNTSLLTLLSPFEVLSWPSPGLMTETKMIPRMTAQIVVVK